MNAKDIRQIKIMVIGSALLMVISFACSALVQYGAINVRLDNLEKRDNQIVEQHNRDIDKMEKVITTVVDMQKTSNR
jgi:hypothetical protein